MNVGSNYPRGTCDATHATTQSTEYSVRRNT